MTLARPYEGLGDSCATTCTIFAGKRCQTRRWRSGEASARGRP